MQLILKNEFPNKKAQAMFILFYVTSAVSHEMHLKIILEKFNLMESTNNFMSEESK